MAGKEIRYLKPPFAGYSENDENPVVEALLSHRSIRRFKDIPISPKALNIILEAAQRAPTSSNYQAYSIIVVDDPVMREKLYAQCDLQRFVADCGILLIFCADISRLIYACEKQGHRFRAKQLDTVLVGHGDALLACQNAAIAAESLSLGTCMLGSIRRCPHEVSNLLELPKYVYATVGLAIGYPDQNPGLKPRLPQRAVISRNKYSSLHQEKYLAEYDQVMCCAQIYHGRIEPLAKVDPKLKETFTEDTYGWLEHTARRLSGSDTLKRKGLARFLKTKGFCPEIE
jgi:nitroreductase